MLTFFYGISSPFVDSGQQAFQVASFDKRTTKDKRYLLVILSVSADPSIPGKMAVPKGHTTISKAGLNKKDRLNRAKLIKAQKSEFLKSQTKIFSGTNGCPKVLVRIVAVHQE